ncbi:unnamed protein product [Peniophora sp. CBMAI 1063]|nr:unnamed protein product [Peniophora sp. CBMAI 1063]
MLPSGLATIILYALEVQPGPFSRGWSHLQHHHALTIKTITYEELTSGRAGIARMYFLASTSPLLAFTIFGLFGMSAEARASYRRAVGVVMGRFRPEVLLSKETRSSLQPIEFGERPRTLVTLSDVGSRLSVVDVENRVALDHDGLSDVEAGQDVAHMKEAGQIVLRNV